MAKIFIADPTEIETTAEDGYRFISANGEIRLWPKRFGRGLSAAGAFNFFMRSGFAPVVVQRDNLHQLSTRDLLVIDIPENWQTNDPRLHQYIDGPWDVLATGCPKPLASALDLKSASFTPTASPYNSVACHFDTNTLLLQPENWGWYEISFNNKSRKNTRSFLKCSEVFGDRFCPKSTGLRLLEKAHLYLECDSEDRKIGYLNAMPFAALQAWLQGQEDLTRWLGWNTRQHWLDDYVNILMGFLKSHSRFSFTNFSRLKLPSHSQICFRHDNDDSTDRSFLEIERQHGIAATYAILDDHNTTNWLGYAQEFPEHEYALHYTTIEPKYKFNKYLKFGISLTPLRYINDKYVFGRKVLSRGKLLKQIELAEIKGIGTKTIHRHFSYVPYPEIIDELGFAFDKRSTLLGSASMFRGRIYRWGTTELNGETATTGLWPDAQHPFWMPFRLADASRRGRILDGWETTLIMEPEPEFFESILSKTHEHLNNRLMTVCFHPFGAKRSPVKQDGTSAWLEACIKICKEKGAQVVRYDEYLDRLNSALGEISE